MKSCILAVDTSTDACSVALLHNGVIHASHKLLPREHTLNILPMIQDLLASNEVEIADVEGFIVGAGPGSFTGLRIAFGVVQGLAFAVNKPVAAISTLAALAYQVAKSESVTDGYVLATIDARMNELYWARYSITGNGLELNQGPNVTSADQLTFEGVKAITGTGLVYENQFVGLSSDVLQDAEQRPRADAMIDYALAHADLVQWQSADQVEPVYVRNNVAKKKSDQNK
ncbi:tRNA (adenosine(37)-N6)-threonylcarbamoyltransferase complex dimerization subunit type 1 TsaB [Litoribacillus peritrichatus]|uniref:tRNA threonylcarbamoyladenosine biosynthesis protein TsaB n=1 Tax=Litoribacillus peritrichatus TaxID=718191 RepID=A0ABP7N8T6_9GAMM